MGAYITIVESKRNLRERLLKLRRSLDEKSRINLSRKVKSNLFGLDEYKKAETVMFYMAHDNEVETREMIMESLGEKRVLLPKVDLERGEIIPVEIKDLDSLERGAFGIAEPTDKKAYRGVIDLVVVPGIAFDLRGYRVGYGKGFYDKFLKRVSSLKIGVAYDFQIVDRIGEDENDVPVDIIITEKRIVRCERKIINEK